MRTFKTTAGLLAMLSFLFYSSFLVAYSPDGTLRGGATAQSFKFMESEITAHYGEVVQICVERNVSLTTATIDLRLENPSGQEVGVGAQSLIFVVGATEACFDFVVPEQTPLGSYAYWIDGVEAEPLKMVEEERSYGICGVFPSHQATGHDPSLYSYDRFGNSYDTEIDNSRFSQLTSAQADAGYFNIRYNPVTIGLSDDELDVICLVFHDLSDLILQRQPENACGEITELMTPNIELTTNIPDNPAVLGTGSAIYNPMGNCYGVSESRVFKKINGGQIFNPDEIDALLNINPEADWLDFDLYSVVYHEALHILGFSAGLSYPEVFDAIPNPTANESSNTFATRWDHILHTVTSDPNVAPLPVLNRTAESFCRKLETSTFPSVDIFISLVEDNCVNNELVLVAGQNTAPIAGISTGQFLNTESDLLNALSHLGGNCIGGNNIPYLMLPSFDVGEEREIQAEEITLLCELGYSVGDCTGCYVLPYWDGVYNRSANYDFYASCCAFDNILCIGETAIISFDQILCNDRIDGSADFDIVDFQIFTVANNIANFEINYDDRTISITGTALGDFTINYIVKGCDDLSIMTTLHLVIEPCIDCSELDPCDNLICTNNFDFENINDNQLIGIIPWFFGNFWISETGDNSLDLCEVEEDNYALRIGAYQDNLEGIAFNLSEPVFPGCELNINFDAFGVSNSGTTILELEILGSSEPPCNAWDRAVNSSCEPTGCENYIYAPYCIGEPESIEVVIERGFSCPDNYPFENHTKTWVNIENEPINVLILSAHFISNNANGIIYLDNLVVTQNCTNAAFDIENNCPNVTFTPALTGDDFIHDWDFGDGSTSTEPNPTHTYPENGSYQVIHTITDDCGNMASSTQVVEIDCISGFSCPCTGTNAINIDAGSIGTPIIQTELAQYMTTEDGGNVLDLRGKCVAISGRLLIENLSTPNSVDLTLFSDEIKMQPGAEIVIGVNATVDFIGDGTTAALVGCEKLWQGISQQTGSRFRVNGYTIEDAQTAIQTVDKTSLVVANNQFSKNYIGIAYSGTDGTDLNITGNTFDGEPDLLPPFDDNLGIQSKSWLGIYLNKSNEMGIPIAIGIESGIPNTFTNLRLGLFAEGNIDLMMANNEFENIRSTPTVNYQNEGYGVYIKGIGGTTLLDFNGNTGSGFNNCRIGIYAEKADVNIYDALMNCNRKGIEVVQSQAEINIKDNTINVPAFGTGISLLHNDGADDILVKDNTITVSSPPEAQNRGAGYGIALQESTNRPPSKNVRILSNIIEMNTGFVNANFNSAGIFLNATNNVRVSNFNEISCATSDDVGILVQGSADCRINNNEITGIGQNGIGLKVENTTNTVYSCNDFNTLKTGAEFKQGNASSTYFIQNNFSPPMGNGLIYRDALSINEQEHHLNKWLGGSVDYSGAAALNENSNPFTILHQLYITHTTASPYWPFMPSVPNIIGGDQIWFSVEGTDDLLAPCGENAIIPPDGKPTKHDKRIVEGLLLTGDYIASRLWAVERSAYDKLLSLDLENLGLSTDELNKFLNFQNIAENGKIGAYHSVKGGLASIYNNTPALQDDWEASWQIKRNLLKDWFELQQSLDENSSETEWNTLADLESDITDLNTKLDLTWQEKQLTANTKTDLTRLANEVLTVDIKPQEYEKAVHTILLNTALSGNTAFDQPQIDLLKDIANQCPLESGIAVHLARSLYTLIDADEEFINDCSGIQALRNSSGHDELAESLKAKLEKKTIRETWHIFPNPANGQVFVQYNSPIGGHIKLVNSFGNLLFSKPLRTGKGDLVINSSSFPSGLYFMQLYDARGKLDSKKIIITH